VTRRFSGILDAPVLAGAPELAKLATAGERLSKFDVFFSAGTATDLSLAAELAGDFRETIYDVTYVDCPSDGGVPDAEPPQVPDGGVPDGSRDPDDTDGSFYRDAQPTAWSDAGAPSTTGGGCSSAGPGAIFLGIGLLTLAPLVRRRRR
jgi:uncharacterized protein (TIGR03382 family)